jgi:hypothetical protein
MNILYVIRCKNIRTVLLKLRAYNQFYMNILYEIICKKFTQLYVEEYGFYWINSVEINKHEIFDANNAWITELQFQKPPKNNLSNLPHQTGEKLKKNHGVLRRPQLGKQCWRDRLGMKLTTHLHQVLMLQMSEAILPQAFMTCTGTNLTLLLIQGHVADISFIYTKRLRLQSSEIYYYVLFHPNSIPLLKLETAHCFTNVSIWSPYYKVAHTRRT